MHKCLILSLATLLFCSCGAWGEIFSMAGGAVLEQTLEHSGYKPEEAKRMTHDFVENIGLNTTNVDRGLDYITARDKYTKQKVVTNFVFDKAIEASGNNAATFSALKEMSDAQLTYLSDSKKAKTKEEKQAAFDTRTEKYAYIFYDGYEQTKQRKAQRLSEKLQIRQQLIRNGSNPEFADDMAGTILAVQNSSDLSEQEKRDYLKAFGFTQTPEQIEEIAETILNTDEPQQTPAGPTPEEIAAKKEAERLEKERIAKENAIGRIQSSVINEYAFDGTDLSDEQKDSLDQIAEILNNYPELSLQIKGHTCDIGYRSVNERVGLRRAETAKSYLTEKGISADRISTLSGGEDEPIVENNSTENRKQNRRLTFTIK